MGSSGWGSVGELVALQIGLVVVSCGHSSGLRLRVDEKLGGRKVKRREGWMMHFVKSTRICVFFLAECAYKEGVYVRAYLMKHH